MKREIDAAAVISAALKESNDLYKLVGSGIVAAHHALSALAKAGYEVRVANQVAQPRFSHRIHSPSGEALQREATENLGSLARPRYLSPLPEKEDPFAADREGDTHEYPPEFVERVLRLAEMPPEATFNNADDMMKWLNEEGAATDDPLPEFRPCVVENTEVGLTSYIHEDVAYYAKPIGRPEHHVDALLAMDDHRLVGVNLWMTATMTANNQRASCLKEAERRAREHECEPGQLQWKWRGNPPPYSSTQEWHRECVSAILDALNREGVVAWDGDAVGCVSQIVQAYAAKASVIRALTSALLATTVSSSGKTITIECNDHDTKDAILNLLTGGQ